VTILLGNGDGTFTTGLRAGYLALVAMEGYKIVLDPAMDIVRTQIRECDERRMLPIGKVE
jgi:hypothetical protein